MMVDVPSFLNRTPGEGFRGHAAPRRAQGKGEDNVAWTCAPGGARWLCAAGALVMLVAACEARAGAQCPPAGSAPAPNAASEPARAVRPASADSCPGRPAPGDSARSYWGRPLVRAERTMVRLSPADPPAWETAVRLPYRLVQLPLRLVSARLKPVVVYADERGVIRTVRRLLRPRQGPFGVVVTVRAGGLSGFGGGLTLEHDAFLGPENRFKLYGQATSEGDYKAVLGLRLPAAAGGQLSIGAGHRNRANARFFGLGPRAPADARSYYRHELSWGGLEIEQPLAGPLTVDLSGLYSLAGAYRAPGDDRPRLPDRHAGAVPAGYGHRVDGATLAAALKIDTTGQTGRPESGGLVRGRVARFVASDGRAVDHWSYRLEVERFIDLWHTRRALAVRWFWSWIDPIGDQDVPLQQLMTNDDPDLLRGFHDFRWRDRGMTALTLEYRWPLKAIRTIDGAGIDAYLLTDIGQVFGGPREIRRDDLQVSWGAGVRLISARGFFARAEIARSAEETVLRLRADQLFQFQKHGLFHGRDPIPIR